MDTISSTLLLGQNSSSTRSFEQHAKSLIQASEANIARIESQIRDLLRLRDQERGILASLKLAIAPVRKVPAEILAEIFFYYVYARCIFVSPNEALKRVLTISRVCAHWRQVACTTPRLWTGKLSISTKKAPSEQYLSTTKSFLERSSPFLIPMVLPMINYNSRHLINALLSTAPRWHSLELHDYFSDEFLQMLPNTLTNLTRLDIKIQRPADYVTAVKVFLSAPRLRQVNLAVRNTAHFPMPWAQLTHLTLSEASPQLSLDILLQCTSVIHAMLWKVNPWAVEPDAAPLVTLPQLKKLEVHFAEDVGDAVHITPFFARLDLPALEDLDMHAGWQNTWSLADFTQFQRRSPNLERLAINASHLEPDDLIDILLVAPNLVDLVLEMCPNCIDDSVLDLLQYTEQAAPMAPRLDSIYAGELETDLSEGIMQKMVKSRWWSDARLAALSAPPAVARWKRLCISRTEGGRYNELSPRFKAKMDLIRSQGLDVDIS